MTTSLPSTPGIVTLTHKQTGAFYYIPTRDIAYLHKKIKKSFIDKGFHYSTIRERFSKLDNIQFTYIETPTYSKAIKMNRECLANQYNNPLLLNKKGFKQSCGFYKLIHKATGKMLVGHSTSVIEYKAHLHSRLRRGKLENNTIQALYNETKKFDDFDYQVTHTVNITEAKLKVIQIVRDNETAGLVVNKNINTRKKPIYSFYILTENRTGYFVYGYCKEANMRLNNIRWLLRSNKHGNKRLQALFNERYPNECFEEIFNIDTFEAVTDEQQNELERQCKEKHLTTGLCINTKK